MSKEKLLLQVQVQEKRIQVRDMKQNTPLIGPNLPERHTTSLTQDDELVFLG